MHGRIDAHRPDVRVLRRDALVHLEEVSITFADRRLAELRDRVAKVEVNAAAARANAAPLVADLLRGARGEVAGGKVATARIAALEIVVALPVADLAEARARRVCASGTQTRPSLRSDSLNNGELRSMFAALRDAGGVNLRKAGIAERCATLVRPPDGRRVRPLRIGREIEDVAVPTPVAENDYFRGVRPDPPGREIPHDDAASAVVDHDEIQHLNTGNHRHAAETDLTLECLIGAEQELLSGLPARVERARDLRAAERAIREHTAVLARERHALGDALIDDRVADLREPMHVQPISRDREVVPLDQMCRRRGGRHCRRRWDSSSPR